MGNETAQELNALIAGLDTELAAASSRGDHYEVGRLARERHAASSMLLSLSARASLADDLEAARGLMADDPAWAGEVERIVAELAELDAPVPDALPRRESCILTVRAGVGGADASLFAAQMLIMYEAWSATNGWDAEEVEAAVGKQGLGVRHASLRVSGMGALSRLAPEAGVHRIQRVPETEAKGRVHTSTATVSVLPEPTSGSGLLDWADIRCDTFRSTGNGGQSVNTTDSAVRLVHGPTGTVVTCSTKSQHRNKALAYATLCARVAEAEESRAREQGSAERRKQVGDGSRSGRTRSYDVPDDVVVDHATGSRTRGVAGVMAGDLSAIEAARDAR